MDNIKNIIFVLGYPITSIGKGTFSANLAKYFLTKDFCHIIKFDGVLNKDLSKLTKDEDIRAEMIDNKTYGGYDFKTYKKICKNLEFSKVNLIVGSQLITKFIEEMKDSNKVLRFIPHLSNFFIEELKTRWEILEKPNNLIIEIGGVIGDLENIYVNHAISMLKKKNNNVSICVLTPLLYNKYDKEIKTRLAQQSIQKSRELNLDVDYFLIRSHEKVSEKEISKISSVTDIDKNKLRLLFYVKEDKFYDELLKLKLRFLL